MVNSGGDGVAFTASNIRVETLAICLCTVRFYLDLFFHEWEGTLQAGHQDHMLAGIVADNVRNRAGSEVGGQAVLGRQL